MTFKVKQKRPIIHSVVFKEYGEHERELVSEFFNILDILCFYIDPVLKERRDRHSSMKPLDVKKYQKDKYDFGVIILRISNFLSLYGYYLEKKKVNPTKEESETVSKHIVNVFSRVSVYLDKLNSFITDEYSLFLKEFLSNVDSKLGINVRVQKPNINYWDVNQGKDFEESFRKFQAQRIDFFLYCCDIMSEFCDSLRDIGLFPISNRLEATVDFARHELFFLEFQKFRVKEQEVIIGDTINDLKGGDLLFYQMRFNYINVKIFKTYLSEDIVTNPIVKALFPKWLFKSYKTLNHNEKEYLRAFHSYYYRTSGNTEFKLIEPDKNKGETLVSELRTINKNITFNKSSSKIIIRGHTSTLVSFILREYNIIIQQLSLLLSIEFAESSLIPKQEERFDQDIHINELPLNYFEDKEDGNTHPHILKIRKKIDVRKINYLLANPPDKIEFLKTGEFIIEDPDIFKKKIALIIEVLKYNTDCKFIVFSTPGVYSTGSGKSTHAMQIAYSFYYILNYIGAYKDEWSDDVFSRDTIDFMKWFSENIEKFLQIKIIDESKGQKGESANTKENQKFREVEDTMRKKSYFYGSCQPHLLTLHNAVIMRAKFLVYVVKEKDSIGLMKPSKAYYLFLNNDTIFSYISKRRYPVTEFVDQLVNLREHKLHTGIIPRKYFYKGLRFTSTWCIKDKDAYLSIADENIKETLKFAYEQENKKLGRKPKNVFEDNGLTIEEVTEEFRRVYSSKNRRGQWLKSKYNWDFNLRRVFLTGLRNAGVEGFE